MNKNIRLFFGDMPPGTLIVIPYFRETLKGSLLAVSTPILELRFLQNSLRPRGHVPQLAGKQLSASQNSTCIPLSSRAPLFSRSRAASSSSCPAFVLCHRLHSEPACEQAATVATARDRQAISVATVKDERRANFKTHRNLDYGENYSRESRITVL